MIGILFLVAACVAQGTAAGFLRGSVAASAIATSSTPLFLPAPEPITEPLIIGRVDAATEASLSASRWKREAKALIEAAPLLITGQVAMPLPDLQRTHLLPPSAPRLRHPLRPSLGYYHASVEWPLQYAPSQTTERRALLASSQSSQALQYHVVPYVGSAVELEALKMHSERIAKQPLEAGNCSARSMWGL